MKSPTFAIVTPSYNHGCYIEDTIRSVIFQTGDFYIDYMVVDGGSTDKTVEILKQYESLLRDGSIPISCRGINFRWISEKDNGMYDAINKGFRLLRGEIMSWLNSDDMYTPWAFKTIHKILSEFKDVEWLTGLHSYLDPDGIMYKSLGQVVYSQQLMKHGCYEGRVLFFVQQEGTFWKRSLWDSAGGKLNDKLRVAGDFELWMRFANYAPLVTVDTALAGFRVSENQASEDKERYYREIDSLHSADKEELAQRVKWRNSNKPNNLLNRILRKVRVGMVPDYEALMGTYIYYDDVAKVWLKKDREI